MPRRDTPQAQVRIDCGPARSERHAQVLESLHAQWGRVVLLVPSTRLASQRLEDVLLTKRLPGAWGRPVETFQSFAARILDEEDLDTRLLGEFERNAILESVVRRLREDGSLGLDAADTPGFVHHMMRVITQLKQAAVDPADFRVRIMESGRTHWLDAVVADVYEGYQAELIACGRYDLVGLYWRAELVCRKKRPPIFERIRHVVLDGFDDFTSSEFRLLESIAPHLETLAFSMTCSLAPSQQDLYATPLATIARIQQTFRAQIVTHEEHIPERLSHYVATHIFYRDPPSPAPAELSNDINLTVHANSVQEIEGIARAVKRTILHEGVAPREVAVLFRDLSEHADMIRAVFQDFGIPATVETLPSLAKSGVGRFIFALLDVAPAWRRDAVLDVLTSAWLGPQANARAHAPDAELSSLFPTLARVAQVIEGPKDWTNKLERLVYRVTNDRGREMTALHTRCPNVETAARALQQALAMLADAVDPLAGAANEHDLVRALRNALHALGVEHAAATPDDRAAWDALMAAFDSIETWTRDNGRTRPYGESANRVRHAMAVASYAIDQPRDGVQVMTFESARHLRFDHVFVAGLVSGVVPQPPAASAIYTDGDIGELESAGIVLESKKGRSARERLLFHHTLTLARRRLHLSWHARSREDKELGASPFIADVRELVEPHVSLNDVRTRVAPPLDDAMNVRDLRNAAALRDVMIDAFARELAPARAAAAIERRRYQSVPFDAFDGMIAETELLARLAEHYGSAHYFSARQLETYARCPFRFLAQEVFRLELPEDPTQELDKRLRGTIMHEALQLFHTQFRGRPVAELGPKEADAAMRDAVAAAFDACTPRDHTTPPAVLTAEAARMTQHLLRYLEHERASNGAWRPAHFEVSFGGTLRGEADAWSRAEPFELKTAAGTILVSGKIDRVDEGDAGLRVVDYKTSITQHSSRAMDDGVDIQLMLYVLALERAIAPGLPPQHAEYVWVGRNQSRDALGKTAHERQATMLEKLAMYVEGIRRGVFSPSPYHDSCTYCDMRRVCRYEEGRITRKIDA